jgi:hypothetical protein
VRGASVESFLSQLNAASRVERERVLAARRDAAAASLRDARHQLTDRATVDAYTRMGPITPSEFERFARDLYDASMSARLVGERDIADNAERLARECEASAELARLLGGRPSVPVQRSRRGLTNGGKHP